MNIGLLHLTDLHLKSSHNIISGRISKICDAIKYKLNIISRLYIVISGDIIDKGDIDAYEQAKIFIDELRNKLNNEFSVSSVVVIVPGNHDCEFAQGNRMRDFVINDMNYDTIGTDDRSVIDTCISIQDNFWKFYSNYNTEPVDKLFYQIVDNIGSKRYVLTVSTHLGCRKRRRKVICSFQLNIMMI